MIKIKYIPFQPHCFAFGGFELQMLNAMEAVNSSFVQATPLNPWSKEKDFDIIHLWGLGLIQYENILWAKRAGKKVVITVLLSYYESLKERIRHLASSLIRKAKYLIEILNMADAIVVVNDLQAQVCKDYFKVSENRIFIIPNIVHSSFYEPLVVSSQLKQPFQNYALVAGNICYRKNQLKIVEACIKNNIHLVLAGNCLEGEEEYFNQIQTVIKDVPIIKLMTGIEPHSDELNLLYKNSSVIALASYIEQQPISLLEGVAAGKPLLIANKAYAKQKYFENALLVNPESSAEIGAGLLEIIKHPYKYISPIGNVASCKRDEVGAAYTNLYKNLLSK